MDYLPEEFLINMKRMLGSEYEDFIASYKKPRKYGLRINTLKSQVHELVSMLPFDTTAIPWTDNGYYYTGQERPAAHPYYLCGLYYLQEPSAMTPAAMLPVTPGDYVLDLCAAPGGKATELGAKLQGEGYLVANDLSNSRCKALLRNLELFGMTNYTVTNESPANLAQRFQGFFNKILVDAPCSGEGMFRKEEAVAKAWTPDKPLRCQEIQKEIVTQAITMLAPGGMILYSTCTFSPLENEEVISYILEKFPQIHILPLEHNYNFSTGNPHWGNGSPELANCIRIFPHRSEGEGHFLALLQKEGGEANYPLTAAVQKPNKEEAALVCDFLSHTCGFDWNKKRLEVRNGKVYLVTSVHPDLRGLKFLRNGLYLGELKKNRFEPSQQLALALPRNGYDSCLNLSPDDQRIPRYLRGETLQIENGETATPKGWQLVCVDGYSLGWGKLSGNILKNKYPAGWRKN